MCLLCSIEAEKELAGENVVTAMRLLKDVCQAHIEKELKPWCQGALASVSGCSLLPSIPEFSILIFRGALSSADTDISKQLAQLLTFYDTCAKLATHTADVKTANTDAGSACTILTQTQKDLECLKADFKLSDLGPILDPLLDALVSVWQKFYTNTIKRAMCKAASCLRSNLLSSECLQIPDDQEITCLRECAEAAWVVTGFFV